MLSLRRCDGLCLADHLTSVIVFFGNRLDGTCVVVAASVSPWMSSGSVGSDALTSVGKSNVTCVVSVGSGRGAIGGALSVAVRKSLVAGERLSKCVADCHWIGGESCGCLTVSNMSSNLTWNCGDASPVRVFRTSATERACIGDMPK
jgi:hypothetical protein